MPERKIARMSGVNEHTVQSPYDFSARVEQIRSEPRFAGMTDAQMREFLREEQREKGMHPSLQGKRF